MKTKQHSNMTNKPTDKKEESDTMKNGCVVCRESLEVLEKKLLSGDYDGLAELQLCATCRTKLLKSVNTAMRGEQDGNQEK